MVHTSTALNTLVVINSGGIRLVDRNSLDLTCLLAGALVIHYCGEGADLGALSAFNAFGLIDMSNVILVKRDSSALTHVLTAVSKTSSAGICYFISCRRTFITGNIDNLNDVGVVLISAHDHLYSLG